MLNHVECHCIVSFTNNLPALIASLSPSHDVRRHVASPSACIYIWYTARGMTYAAPSAQKGQHTAEEPRRVT